MDQFIAHADKPGETVPEFERTVFELPARAIAPRLIEARFGFHIVRVGCKTPGETLPLEGVKDTIAHFLKNFAATKATRQYLQLLLGHADIQGIEMQGVAGSLLQ